MLQNSRKAQLQRHLLPVKASVQVMIGKTEVIGRLQKEPLDPGSPRPTQAAGKLPLLHMAEEAEGCLLNRLNPGYLGVGTPGHMRVMVRHHIEGRELSESLCVKCCEPSFLLLSSPRTYSLQKEVWGTFLCRNQCTQKRMLTSVPTSIACPSSPPSSPD